MTNKEILNTIEHRPWDLPTNSWHFYQEWNNAIFLHWKVDVDELQKFVPKALDIDLYNGKAYISLVAFTMEKIRPKHLPAFPPVSNFHEINIRTYVKYNGKAGVYFLSIEGSKQLSCIIAKGISQLPYRFSKMQRRKNSYQSSNNSFKDRLDLQFELGNSTMYKTKLDKWLTERYALFQDYKNKLNSFEIHHVEWPTQEINITNLKIDYPRFKNLFNNSPDIVQYAKGVKVLAWNKQSTLL